MWSAGGTKKFRSETFRCLLASCRCLVGLRREAFVYMTDTAEKRKRTMDREDIKKIILKNIKKKNREQY